MLKGAQSTGCALFFVIQSSYLCCMKRLLLAIAATLFSFILSAQNSDSQVPEPGIRFDTQRIDYGEVLYRKDSTYLYLFPYENTGTAPLIVNNVNVSCPCVRIKFSTDPLPPGQRDTVFVYFKPGRASKYTQRMMVFTNSPESGIFLYAKGTFLKRSEWRARQQQKTDSQ